VVTAILLSAGYGERLKPLTFSVPKPLIKIMGKPIIRWIIDDLSSCGIDDYVVVVGHYSIAVKDYVENSGINARFAYQSARLGVADAIMRGIDAGVSEPFIVVFTDNYFHGGMCSYARRFIEERDYDAYIVLATHRRKELFGNVVIQDGKVKTIIEKPKQPPENSYVLTGLMAFRDADTYAKLFSKLSPSSRGEFEITDLLTQYLVESRTVKYVITKDWWKDMGTYDDLLELIQYMLDEIREPRIYGAVDGNIHGRVIVESGAEVHGDVYGPAYIGRNTIIERGASVEHFVNIEDSVRISGERSRITRTFIYDNAQITMINALLHDSVVGPNSIINARDGSYRLIIGERSVVETF
jgi:glucose-1-phosphate thymidylyltransferase